MGTNIYEIVYDESRTARLDKNSPEFQKAVIESTTVAHLVKASNLREALDKVEAQKLVYFTVSDLKLIKTNVNLL